MNVLIWVNHSLRAGHLSCYTYRRSTTPSIGKRAAQGVLFTYKPRYYHVPYGDCLPLLSLPLSLRMTDSDVEDILVSMVHDVARSVQDEELTAPMLCYEPR